MTTTKYKQLDKYSTQLKPSFKLIWLQIIQNKFKSFLLLLQVNKEIELGSLVQIIHT